MCLIVKWPPEQLSFCVYSELRGQTWGTFCAPTMLQTTTWAHLRWQEHQQSCLTTVTIWQHLIPTAQRLKCLHSRDEQRLAVFSFPLLGGYIKGRQSELAPTPTITVTLARQGDNTQHLRGCQQEVLKYKRISIVLAPFSSTALRQLTLLY